MAVRHDAVELSNPKLLPNGHYRVDAVLTRAGVFVYRNADGTARREYRPPAEVFRADSLDTFALVPVTNDHPSELLDANNTKQYQVGTVGENVRQDGEVVRSSMVITDAKTIADMKAGKVQVSCGYVADTTYTPGVTPQGEKYDAIQSNMRGNHVAIVMKGKAGPDARVRLDADEAEMVEAVPHNDSRERTMKVIINGVEYDIPDTACQALSCERQAMQAKLDAKDTEIKAGVKSLETATAKLDAAVEAGKQVQVKLDAAVEPTKMTARVNERVALVVVANEHLAEGIKAGTVKLDTMTDDAIKAAVVVKLAPDVKLDGKSADYVQARYEIAIEGCKTAPGAGIATLRTTEARTDATAGAATSPTDDKAARERMRTTNAQMGTAPLTVK